MLPRDHSDRVARWERWLTPGLLALTVSIYTLLVTGAVVSLTDAAGACSTWPTCDGALISSIGDSAVMIALGHRLMTLLVFVLLISMVVLSWRSGVPRKVRYTLLATAGFFPLQMAIGAVTVTTGGSSLLTSIHLLLAMLIFTGGLLALLFWLEWSTRDIEASFDATAPIEEDASTAHAVSKIGPMTTIQSYVSMTKPRLMWLLCFVAIAGMALAATSTGTSLTTEVSLGTVIGGMLAIGASGVFNHLYERDVDRRMARTADRPLATHTVSMRRAAVFGVVLTLASIGVFLALTNALAAGLGLVAIGFYSIIYTVVLKPNTSQNIVLGGAVGAFPAIIGWAAVTGSIGIPVLVLGLIIFLWTPAHFYNLALVYKRDYARGNFPMLPVVRGERVTQRHIVLYAGATLLCVALLGAIGGLGWLYGATAVIAGGGFLYTIVHLYEHQNSVAAMRTFHASNAFLGVLMVAIILELLIL